VKKLSFRETTELAQLPDRIDALEREREKRYAALSDPALVRDGAAMTEARARLAALEAEIAELTERWEALETIAAGGAG
jgi:ATP-binding cassette subfamily F protein uup